MTVPYLVGTMIETPRAALIAGQLAELAQFLSFGTNDLTQLTYGFSRDDVEAQLLTAYVEKDLLPVSPFASLDPDGVGALIRTAIAQRAPGQPDDQARHLRRARRRPGLDRAVRAVRPGLRVVLALAGAGRAAGVRARGRQELTGSLSASTR